jgi:hypothetical protein
MDSQNTRLLITVLEMIKVKYENGSQTEASPKTDMQLIVNILNKLIAQRLQVKFLLMMARQVLQQCPVIYLDV